MSFSVFVRDEGPDLIDVDTGDDVACEMSEHPVAACGTHLFFGAGRKVIIDRHFLRQVVTVFLATEETIDSMFDDGPAAGGIGSDECLAHAGPFQQAQGHSLSPIGRQNDAVGLFDKRRYPVGVAEVGDDTPVRPFLYLLPGNGQGVVVIEKAQKEASHGESLLS